MPDAVVGGSVGPQGVKLADGVTVDIALDNVGAALVSERQARFQELAQRGALYGGGMTVTSINNVTFTSATLGATCTPILGLWNPLNSSINCVMLQAALAVAITALQATGGGPFVWAVATGQSALTLGGAPWKRNSLVQVGSVAKTFMSSPALTGLVGNLAVMEGSELTGGSALNIATLQTAAGFVTQAVQKAVQDFDGSLIVPPGGVLALLATTTPVAHSAAGRLLWAEVPA